MKVTLIIGQGGTGKTLLAKMIVDGKKAYWAHSSDMNPHSSYIPQDVDFVVYDEFSFKDKAISEYIKMIISQKEIVIKTKGKAAVKNSPHFILITNDKKSTTDLFRLKSKMQIIKCIQPLPISQ